MDEWEIVMEWVLFVSLQWIVLGSASQSNTQQIGQFASEALCKQAADAIRTELNAPIAGQRAQTLGRIVCFERRDR
jgi:hypothetical protein